MVKRYGGYPTPEQLAKDPIVSRLKPALAESFRADISHMAAQAGEKPTQ
jgi:hypothetical protein